MRALQLDHINDNGSQERKDLGSQKFSGVKFYEYLIKQGLPDGYQILCANCNNIKQWNKNKAEPKRIELSSQAWQACILTIELRFLASSFKSCSGFFLII